MKAEERLDAMIVGAKYENAAPGSYCEFEALARTAIALLRDQEMFDIEHASSCAVNGTRTTGLERYTCNCGVWELHQRIRKFLDGDA